MFSMFNSHTSVLLSDVKVLINSHRKYSFKIISYSKYRPNENIFDVIFSNILQTIVIAVTYVLYIYIITTEESYE